MAKRPPKRRPKITKTVHLEVVLGGRRKGSRLKEEVWTSNDGQVVKYSLAYIDPRVCGKDNGRVLGYDNSHGDHHRHFMGQVEPVNFDGYEAILKRFRKELRELWAKER